MPSSDAPGCRIPAPTTLLPACTLNQMRHPLGSRVDEDTHVAARHAAEIDVLLVGLTDTSAPQSRSLNIGKPPPCTTFSTSMANTASASTRLFFASSSINFRASFTSQRGQRAGGISQTRDFVTHKNGLTATPQPVRNRHEPKEIADLQLHAATRRPAAARAALDQRKNKRSWGATRLPGRSCRSWPMHLGPGGRGHRDDRSRP